VLQHFNIDTSNYSFAYIAGWSSGKETKELKNSLDVIRKESSLIIAALDTALDAGDDCSSEVERAATIEQFYGVG